MQVVLRGTARYYKVQQGTKRCCEILQVVLQVLLVVVRGTTRNYEVLQVVLQDTMRYCDTTRHYEVLRVLLQVTMRWYEWY